MRCQLLNPLNELDSAVVHDGDIRIQTFNAVMDFKSKQFVRGRSGRPKTLEIMFPVCKRITLNSMWKTTMKR